MKAMAMMQACLVRWPHQLWVAGVCAITRRKMRSTILSTARRAA